MDTTASLCSTDGIVLALRPGVTPAHAAGCLGDAASLALGYPMPGTLETMEHDAHTLFPLPSLYVVLI